MLKFKTGGSTLHIAKKAILFMKTNRGNILVLSTKIP